MQLVERDTELGLIDTQLRAIAGGSGRCVLVGSALCAGPQQAALADARLAAHGGDLGALLSSVSEDVRKTCCVYDAPDPEGIRTSACDTHLPINRITPVPLAKMRPSPTARPRDADLCDAFGY